LLALSPGQTTQSHLVAQDEDPILHAAYGQVAFNKDDGEPGVDQGRKYLLSSYFIMFSLPNIYMQIRPGVTLAWSSATLSQA
jgi:hypothetical protein